MSAPPPSAPDAKPISRGGFAGVPEGTISTSHKARESHKAYLKTRFDASTPVMHADPQRVRLAEVPFDGWEKEKEGRVKVAFDRIIERDWYDKYEHNLKPVEQVHVNAVREHYAMRRDKLKTPDIRARPGSNTLPPNEWAANMEALDSLKRETNVGTFFRGLVGRKMSSRAKEKRAAKQQNEFGF